MQYGDVSDVSLLLRHKDNLQVGVCCVQVEGHISNTRKLSVVLGNNSEVDCVRERERVNTRAALTAFILSTLCHVVSASV
jgi:hypothetical protein